MNVKNNLLKKIVIAFVIVLTISIPQTVTYASTISKTTISSISSTNCNIAEEPITRIAGMSEIINAGKSFIQDGRTKAQGNDAGIEDFANQFIDIGQVLVSIGVVALIIATAVMGIQWISATPDKMAKLKKQAIGLIVSAIVIFGAIGIWTISVNIAQKVEDGIAYEEVIKKV